MQLDRGNTGPIFYTFCIIIEFLKLSIKATSSSGLKVTFYFLFIFEKQFIKRSVIIGTPYLEKNNDFTVMILRFLFICLFILIIMYMSCSILIFKFLSIF